MAASTVSTVSDAFWRALRAALPAGADLGTDIGTRAAYTMDASNHRRVPLAVVRPRTVDEVNAAVAVARAHEVPIVPRGAGTSIGGQATGLGLVIDFSRYLTAIEPVDPGRRLVRVQPGAVLDDVRAAAAPHGLTFGPDPSTHSRCTIGGMIGNNSCGAHSVAWGKTSENIESLDVLTIDGRRLTVGRSGGTGVDTIDAALHDLVDPNLAPIRRALSGTMTRRVSGYALDALLPEAGFDVARSLVGTEGSCVTLLGATLRLVPTPPARTLVVAGFPDEDAAARAVPSLLAHGPLTVESLSPELLGLASRRPPELPAGDSWLLMEMGGDDRQTAVDAARALGGAVRAVDARARVLVVTEPAAQRAIWRVRDDAAGSATRLADGTEAWPGWEDAAVPVEHLADYLARFRALLAAHELRGVPYGHFGEGCVHVRIGFDLVSPAGISTFESFLDQATDLVVEYGGSYSGEHGDGLARGQYLPKLFGPDVMSLFRRYKAIWDPRSLMNPGIIAKPEPVTTTLRFGPSIEFSAESAATSGKVTEDTVLTYPDDAGSFAQAVRRCVGVGRCVQHGAQAGGAAMCPSFQVTREERHSTRGRAHLLGEMLRGDLITDGWHSDDVAEALDLCLGCKACLSECPVSVDMASYKTEFLHRHYAGRVRPATHYAMGWLPLWVRLGTVAPGLVNLLTRGRMTGGLVRRVSGIAPQRSIPSIAPTTLRAAVRHRRARASAGGRRALLWPDTFTSFFAPEIGVAAVRVLEDAGFAVEIPRRAVCCGLTWLSTGQVDVARSVARRSLAGLPPDVPIVGLEPSCTTALREDVPRLLDSETARSVAGNTYTLAEFLEAHAPDWRPRVHARQAVGQVHCHQAATAGYDAEQRLLAAAGVDLTVPQASCCGLAGDFGMARDHYDVSVACAGQGLVQAVRGADESTLVLADGFSCRLQITDLTPRQPVHIAQLLAAGLV